MTKAAIFLGLGYAAVLVTATATVVVARQRVEQSLTTPQAQAEWEAWRAETVKQSQPGGPVVRRPAKAPEPPLLILLRDHYPMALGSTMLAVTLFYWFLAFLIRGSMRTPAAHVANAATAVESEAVR